MTSINTVSSNCLPICNVWVKNDRYTQYRPNWILTKVLIDSGASIGLVNSLWCQKNGFEIFKGTELRVKAFNNSINVLDKYCQFEMFEG